MGSCRSIGVEALSFHSTKTNSALKILKISYRVAVLIAIIGLARDVSIRPASSQSCRCSLLIWEVVLLAYSQDILPIRPVCIHRVRRWSCRCGSPVVLSSSDDVVCLTLEDKLDLCTGNLFVSSSDSHSREQRGCTLATKPRYPASNIEPVAPRCQRRDDMASVAMEYLDGPGH